ncbi:MAG: tRNA 5-methoxyuridine(34)/uridine 5-oxyacetic acid(34) synthase CmoB [Candidatus Omnitrophica bacterium]|nr:tRNA 5-methoxyuridine(34)/uridine 5-oxyacetic acid(34) synthase CmoB [Candidatus Omnitrophota bacterium]
MIDYSYIYDIIKETSLAPWIPELPKQIEQGFDVGRWGDLPRWFDVLNRLPSLNTKQILLDQNVVTVGHEDEINPETYQQLSDLLKEFHPWRKGPFNFFGIQIETEWRSDLKWDRLKNDISSLQDRVVLDVGCGNGYHCWRAAADGAKAVIGIDPTVLYVIQFWAMQKYAQSRSVAVLPLGIDDMPDNLSGFDTVFSMGLLYHRRAPFDHLLRLKSFLREEGEFVLETLVIDGKQGEVLSPSGRYAKMPNVWFIPSVPTLESWLQRVGLKNVRCVDVTKTTSEEQRVTEWMGFHSLENFLNPDDPSLTVEGYPAPVRAVFLAQN